MLQGLNLPFVDLTSPENSLKITLTGSVADAETGASFADIFRLAPERQSIAVPESGTGLPNAGKDLPDKEELVSGSPESNDAGNIFWSGTVALDPSPQLPRLAMASPVAVNPHALAPGDRFAMQLSLPAVPAGKQILPVLPTPVAKSAVDVTPPSLATASSTAPLAPLAPLAPPAPGAAAIPVTADPAAALLATAAPPAAAMPIRRPPHDGAGRIALATDLPPELKPAALLPPAPALATQLPTVPVPGKPEDEALLTPQLSQLQSLPSTPFSTRGGVESAPPPVTPLPAIATPVQDSAWGDRLGERLLMMADSKTQVAEIRLSPAELGPLRVRIAIEDGATSVTFHAQHAITREALEQALPRLRDLFANNGLTLAESHIADAGEQGMSQGNPGQRDAERLSADLSIDANDELTTDVPPHGFSPTRRPEQLLDTFA